MWSFRYNRVWHELSSRFYVQRALCTCNTVHFHVCMYMKLYAVVLCIVLLHAASACFLKVYQAALERGEDLGLMTSDVLLHDVLSDLYCISKGVKAYQTVVLP